MSKRIEFGVYVFVKKRTMSIMITDKCINCGACEPECPNNAIYEGGTEWNYSDGTSLKGIIKTINGDKVHADQSFKPVKMGIY